MRIKGSAQIKSVSIRLIHARLHEACATAKTFATRGQRSEVIRVLFFRVIL
jgi:hypothetical protein